MRLVELTQLVTTEEMLALPADGIDRCLIRGRLRETSAVYYRSHGRILAAMVVALEQWIASQVRAAWEVRFGRVTVRLRRNPDTAIGADVALVPTDAIARLVGEKSLLDESPIAIVKILCPSMRFAEIYADLDCLREANVPFVWMIDPHDQTVTVYRPNAEPELFNVPQELSGEPHLPGFRVPVARLFS